ncbi:MAG TPA: ornithine cyclodeaminase family protein [candidate division Zixibacteria bacterium]|nr:ornithine cyclodeaminase family protein [candidate division Zixibacteria bacterium]
MHIFTLEQIKAVLPDIDLIPEIEDGFRRYSAGQSVVPPVGELLLDKGEVHIKYGYLQGGDYYVIKVASGFYGNTQLGLPSSNGLMLMFNQQTGQSEAILLDEGFLTDIRTAVAGSIAAKYLAPLRVERIGIVGTGIQARLQLRYLRDQTTCRDVLVWGRGESQLNTYANEMVRHGFRVESTMDTAILQESCKLIVTTTPAVEPLLKVEHLQPGTHITAVGSDTPHKQELDARILARADLLVADSITQCLERGEIHQAIKAGLLSEERLVELGHVISGEAPSRSDQAQITIADLTGVAVQDIAIATAVLKPLLGV